MTLTESNCHDKSFIHLVWPKQGIPHTLKKDAGFQHFSSGMLEKTQNSLTNTEKSKPGRTQIHEQIRTIHE